MGRRAVDMIGRRCGRLSILSRSSRKKASGDALWNCQCDCGVILEASGPLLRRGAVKSCGCLKKEVGAAALAFYAATGMHGALRHGDARAGKEAPEWRLWHSIKRRCADHPDYAGRGIRMCDEWQRSYEAFLKSVGRRPSAEYSLDRIDVFGHYEPGNVRWATKKEQARNRRTNLFITANGERRTLAEWAERTGLKNTTIRSRIRKGWMPEAALGTPVAG